MKALGLGCWFAMLGLFSAQASAGLDLRLPWERSGASEAASQWVKSSLRAYPPPTQRPAKNRYRSVPGKGKVIAFTFDDGPRPWTKGVLDALKERGLKGTFFVTGTEAVTYPSLLKRMVAEGHEVANHTLTHSNNHLDRAPHPVVEKEVSRAHETILKITGAPPRVFRPPGGNFTEQQSQWIYDQFGYADIRWSVDPGDGDRVKPSTTQFRNRIMSQVRDGAIILSHDLHRSTVAAIPSTLDALMAKGYRFLTVSELIALDDPYEGLGWAVQELEFLDQQQTGE